MTLDEPGEIRFTSRAPVCYRKIVMRRRLWWTGGVAGGLVLALLLLWPPRSTTRAAPAAPATNPPEVTVQDFHLIETRGGATLWDVRADRAEVHEQEGYAVLSRVTHPIQVTLYSASRGQLVCTAQRAIVDLKSKYVQLEGAVTARSDQGAELKTEALRWIAASRQLRTDQPVTVSRGNLLTRGRGLEAETALERVQILQNITSQLSPAGGALPAPGRTARP